MKVFLHQTHHTLADFAGVEQYLKDFFNKPEHQEGLHLFPELFLTGYPLQDLCLQKPFIAEYQRLLERLQRWMSELPKAPFAILLGGLHYQLNENGLPDKIQNAIIGLLPGQPTEFLYHKRLLPNYDIFDEQKYFSPGTNNKVWEWNGFKMALTICEDMWSSNFHQMDPCIELANELKGQGQSVDLVINLSASPYNVGKKEKRHERAKELASHFGAPFLYVNRVAAEDEILFDGNSFIADESSILAQAQGFTSEILSYELAPKNREKKINPRQVSVPNTWETLFAPQMNFANGQLPALIKWNDHQLSEMLQALQFGLQEYARKNGMNKFLVALSGGMDSALVVAIIRLCLKPGQTLETIYMPSIYSSSVSYDLSAQLCQKLGVKLKTLPIKFLHSTAKNLFTQTFEDPFAGLTDENIQSRLRGLLLYTRSNQINAMVINTSNKSELAVGYSTQYGDSVGAISLLGDLYKTEVYQLAEYINRTYDAPIPAEILTREPTAELRSGQKDSDSLPIYPVLDAILEGILSYRYNKQDMIKMGFSTGDLEKVFNLYLKSEYKRGQFCPIIKIKSKSFGFGYRVPISKNIHFYFH